MDRRETVIESIQKLLALGVSDSEISENLYDVGIAKEEALALIAEAKKRSSVSSAQGQNPQGNQQASQAQQGTVQSGVVSTMQPLQGKSSEDYFEETVSELSMNDQIIRQIPINKTESGVDVANQKNIASQKVGANQNLNVKSNQSLEEKSSDDIADRIMADVSKQDAEEDIEDQVGAELNSVANDSDKTPSPQSTTKTISQTGPQPQFQSQFQSQAQAQTQQKNQPQSQSQTQSQSQQQSQPQLQQSQPQFQPQSQSQPQSPKVKSVQPAKSNPSSRAQVIDSAKNFSSIPQNFTSPQSFASNQNYSDVQNFSPAQVPSPDLGPGFEELWKKGIVVAVNSKLSEMKRLKEDVDVIVQQKVDESVRKELFQYKVLLDSQKELMISSNKEALEQKQKEIVFIIDSKIAELKQYNKQLSETLIAIESAKKQQELALSQIALALDDAKKTKSQMIVEMNSEMIKSKSQAQAFLDQSSAHLAQMDERINKTLELEKNIAEGMLAQAEQKIETLTIQRADELIENLEVELNRLQTASKKISPEMLEQKIAVLDEFKKQFLTSMQSSLAQINTAIEELNQKNIIADRTLQEKTLAIDAKLEELTKFEKEFTQGLDNLLK